MARMYFSFKTNFMDSSDDILSPQLETIEFITPDRKIIRVGCEGEAEWGIEHGLFSGRFKGLEYEIEDQDGNTILEYGDELTDEQLTILKKATPVKVVFWTDDVRYDGFTPGCKNLKVRIEHNTKKQEYVLDFKVKKDVVTEMA